MTEAKHKAPWSYDVASETISDAAGEVIGRMEPVSGPLATAAPTMLEALKTARDQTYATQHSQETRLNDIYDILTDAIAKAEAKP